MRGGNGIDNTVGHELTKPAVAQSTRGFFNGFGALLILGIAGLHPRLRSGIDAGFVKWEAEGRGEVARKGEICIGLIAAESVVKMSGVQNEAQFPAALGEYAQEGDRISTTGEADGETESGLELRDVDLKRRGFGSAHQRMIRRCSRIFRACRESAEFKRSIHRRISYTLRMLETRKATVADAGLDTRAIARRCSPIFTKHRMRFLMR